MNTRETLIYGLTCCLATCDIIVGLWLGVRPDGAGELLFSLGAASLPLTIAFAVACIKAKVKESGSSAKVSE